jgi:hypothetical protein
MTEELNENVRVARAIDELDAEEGGTMEEEENVEPEQSHAPTVVDLLNERRKGMIVIEQRVLAETSYEIIRSLQTVMFVMETSFSPLEQVLVLMGVSPFFEALDEGVVTPTYHVQIDMENRTLKVQRILDHAVSEV